MTMTSVEISENTLNFCSRFSFHFLLFSSFHVALAQFLNQDLFYDNHSNLDVHLLQFDFVAVCLCCQKSLLFFIICFFSHNKRLRYKTLYLMICDI